MILPTSFDGSEKACTAAVTNGPACANVSLDARSAPLEGAAVDSGRQHFGLTRDLIAPRCASRSFQYHNFATEAMNCTRGLIPPSHSRPSETNAV